MIENKESKIQFRIELILALIVTGLACAAGFSSLLFASNELGHPIATDLMGHMAKVQYIAQSIKEGIAPTWFPYWYCGTPVTQYYPPLSYLLMVPIYAFAENVTLSFKIYCFIVLFSGGIGVWFFCRTYIGKWCGLFGCVVFCLQPYTLQTLFTQGQIAQGPIIALTPWYLLAIISYSQRPTVRK
ncbi:MAG: 6-pyruvoyl-tetrahydropterin synthase-related protein, partial [Eubacteriales bacterium]|nr:6-pyruvoyl-tetrahydropterin synthase-related protein [Eubacteriales bacterium]